ncbi:MAG: hypothetical protein ACFFCS_22060, partial [Candidatus Hodarchaeota archaeon]
AREAAFRKKVAPIPYQLTLNYSIFTQAQVPITLDYEAGGSITTYPMKPLSAYNISVNFYNQTFDQVNYSADCVNASQLNHVMYLDTSNITKPSDPMFLLSEGIQSPFLLSMDQNYTINDTITLPLIFYDNKSDPNRNLTYTGDLINLTYVRDENFPTMYRKVMVFSHVSSDTVATVFYDYYTRIMVYLDYKNTSVINETERVVFALFENNQSYQVNQEIIIAPEVLDYGTILVNDTLFGILYDPPGDNSYSQMTAGTTLSMSYSMDSSDYDGFFINAEALGGAFGATAGAGTEFSYTTTTTDGFSVEMAITVEQTMTSSLNTEDATLIGPGRGDLYFGAAVVIEWQIIVDAYYIANGTQGENSTTWDDISVWKNNTHLVYSPGIDASFSALGAYLDSYNISHMHNQNPFIDNVISTEESGYLQQVGGTLLWTPSYATELAVTLTTGFTISRTVEVEMDMSTYAAWDVDKELLVATIKSNGKVGANFGWKKTTTTTSSTEFNKQILVHLEDDDGTPVGEHDQFLMDIYLDKRYGTEGFIFYRQSTYTSYPYEFGTKDRRSPVVSELLNLEEWLHGNTTLQALAVDDETGVKVVEFYWGNIPYFIDGVTTRLGYQTTATSTNIYQCTWDTTIIPTSYGQPVYLFVVTSDNADLNYSNKKISEPYPVKIDNAAPYRCSVMAYTPYEKVIPLYASVRDNESGIDYVEYWLGIPDAPGSTYLGMSDLPSTAYEYLWATDPGGADDGTHLIYARTFDKAGNSLNSKPIEIQVQNIKFLTAEAEAAILTGATMGGVGVGGWALIRYVPDVLKKVLKKKKTTKNRDI